VDNKYIAYTHTNLSRAKNRENESEAKTGTLKMRDMKLRDMKMRYHVAGVENARHENARKAIVWNTACCICLSTAEQECMSRQERAPDFAAKCARVPHLPV